MTTTDRIHINRLRSQANALLTRVATAEGMTRTQRARLRERAIELQIQARHLEGRIMRLMMYRGEEA